MSEARSNDAIRQAVVFLCKQGGSATLRVGHGAATVSMVLRVRMLLLDVVVDGSHLALVLRVVRPLWMPRMRGGWMLCPSTSGMLLLECTVARRLVHKAMACSGTDFEGWDRIKLGSDGMGCPAISIVCERRRRLGPVFGHCNRSSATRIRISRLMPTSGLFRRLRRMRGRFGKSRFESGKPRVWRRAPCDEAAAIRLRVVLGYRRWSIRGPVRRGAMRMMPGYSRGSEVVFVGKRAARCAGAIDGAWLRSPVRFDLVGMEHLPRKAGLVL